MAYYFVYVLTGAGAMCQKHLLSGNASDNLMSALHIIHLSKHVICGAAMLLIFR